MVGFPEVRAPQRVGVVWHRQDPCFGTSLIFRVTLFGESRASVVQQIRAGFCKAFWLNNYVASCSMRSQRSVGKTTCSMGFGV